MRQIPVVTYTRTTPELKADASEPAVLDSTQQGVPGTKSSNVLRARESPEKGCKFLADCLRMRPAPTTSSVEKYILTSYGSD